MRLVGSTRANPYAAAAAAIAALWGPLHGGANEAVLQTLAEIGSGDRIPGMLRPAQGKDDPFPLSRFGHRVYKNYDPRGQDRESTRLNSSHPVISYARLFLKKKKKERAT